jgi:hypothetical protein
MKSSKAAGWFPKGTVYRELRVKRLGYFGKAAWQAAPENIFADE